MDQNETNLKQSATSGLLWKLVEKGGTQIIQFIVSLILARLISPEEYGIVGLLTIFIALSDIIIQQGLVTALIQKKNTTELDYSSVFWVNFLFSIFIYIILYLIAPLIAEFYNEQALISIMRVISLNVIIGSLSSVHYTILVKKLDFKKSFFRGLSNTITYGLIGIVLGSLGFGAWSLVFARIAGTAASTLTSFLTVRWKPSLHISLNNINSMFNFSSKLLLTSIANTIFNNIHSLIIGRFFSKSDLGYYQRGQQIPQTVLTAIDGSLSEVLYPTFSIIQDNLSLLKAAMRRSLKISLYVVLPLLAGLYATAEPLILILLTDKWELSIPFLRLSCIICAFWPLSAREHALNAIGKSNVTLKLSIINKSITLIFIFICLPLGIYAIMYSTIFASFISLFISCYYINRYIHYTVREFIRDILPIILLSVSMCFIIYFFNFLAIPLFLKLSLQTIIGVIIYLLGSYILKLESFYYILDLLKKIPKNRKY